MDGTTEENTQDLRDVTKVFAALGLQINENEVIPLQKQLQKLCVEYLAIKMPESARKKKKWKKAIQNLWGKKYKEFFEYIAEEDEMLFKETGVIINNAEIPHESEEHLIKWTRNYQELHNETKKKASESKEEGEEKQEPHKQGKRVNEEALENSAKKYRSDKYREAYSLSPFSNKILEASETSYKYLDFLFEIAEAYMRNHHCRYFWAIHNLVLLSNEKTALPGFLNNIYKRAGISHPRFPNDKNEEEERECIRQWTDVLKLEQYRFPGSSENELDDKGIDKGKWDADTASRKAEFKRIQTKLLQILYYSNSKECSSIIIGDDDLKEEMLELAKGLQKLVSIRSKEGSREKNHSTEDGPQMLDSASELREPEMAVGNNIWSLSAFFKEILATCESSHEYPHLLASMEQSYTCKNDRQYLWATFMLATTANTEFQILGPIYRKLGISCPRFPEHGIEDQRRCINEWTKVLQNRRIEWGTNTKGGDTDESTRKIEFKRIQTTVLNNTCLEDWEEFCNEIIYEDDGMRDEMLQLGKELDKVAQKYGYGALDVSMRLKEAFGEHDSPRASNGYPISRFSQQILAASRKSSKYLEFLGMVADNYWHNNNDRHFEAIQKLMLLEKRRSVLSNFSDSDYWRFDKVFPETETVVVQRECIRQWTGILNLVLANLPNEERNRWNDESVPEGDWDADTAGRKIQFRRIQTKVKNITSSGRLIERSDNDLKREMLKLANGLKEVNEQHIYQAKRVSVVLKQAFGGKAHMVDDRVEDTQLLNEQFKDEKQPGEHGYSLSQFSTETLASSQKSYKFLHVLYLMAQSYSRKDYGRYVWAILMLTNTLKTELSSFHSVYNRLNVSYPMFPKEENEQRKCINQWDRLLALASGKQSNTVNDESSPSEGWDEEPRRRKEFERIQNSLLVITSSGISIGWPKEIIGDDKALKEEMLELAEELKKLANKHPYGGAERISRRLMKAFSDEDDVLGDSMNMYDSSKELFEACSDDSDSDETVSGMGTDQTQTVHPAEIRHEETFDQMSPAQQEQSGKGQTETAAEARLEKFQQRKDHNKTQEGVVASQIESQEAQSEIGRPEDTIQQRKRKTRDQRKKAEREINTIPRQQRMGRHLLQLKRTVDDQNKEINDLKGGHGHVVTKLESKISALEGTIAEKNSRIDDLQRSKRDLEDSEKELLQQQRAQAERITDLEIKNQIGSDVAQSEIAMTQPSIRSLTETVQRQDSTIKTLEDAALQAEIEKSELLERLEEQSQEHQKLADLEETLSRIKKEAMSTPYLRAQIKSLGQVIKEKESEMENMKKHDEEMIQSSKEEIRKRNLMIEDLQGTEQIQKDKLIDKQEKIEHWKREATAFRSMVKKLERNIQEIESKMSHLQEEKAQVDAQRSEALASLEKQGSILGKLKATLGQIKEEAKNAPDFRSQVKELDQVIKDKESEMDMKNEMMQRLEGEIRERNLAVEMVPQLQSQVETEMGLKEKWKASLKQYQEAIRDLQEDQADMQRDEALTSLEENGSNLDKFKAIIGQIKEEAKGVPALRSEVKELKQVINDKELEMKNAKKEMTQRLEEEIRERSLTVAMVSQLKEEGKTALKQYQERIRDLQEEKNKADAQRNEAVASQTASEEAQSKRQTQEGQSRTIRQLQDDLRRANLEIDHLTKEQLSASKSRIIEITRLEKDNATIRTQLASKENEMREQNQNLHSRMTQLEDERRTVQETLESQRQELRDVRHQATEVNEARELMQKQLSRLIKLNAEQLKQRLEVLSMSKQINNTSRLESRIQLLRDNASSCVPQIEELHGELRGHETASLDQAAEGEKARLWILKLFVARIRGEKINWEPYDEGGKSLDRVLEIGGLKCKEIVKKLRCFHPDKNINKAIYTGIFTQAQDVLENGGDLEESTRLSPLYTSFINSLVRLDQDFRNATATIDTLKETVRRIQTEERNASELQRAIDCLQQELKKKSETEDHLEKKIQHLETAKRHIDKQKEDSLKTAPAVSQPRSQDSSLEEEAEDRRKIKDLEVSSIQLRSKICSLEKEVGDKKKRIDDLEATVRRMHEQVQSPTDLGSHLEADLEAGLESSKNDVGNLPNDIERTDSIVEDLETRVRGMEEAVRGATTPPSTIDRLHDEKEANGRMPLQKEQALRTNQGLRPDKEAEDEKETVRHLQQNIQSLAADKCHLDNQLRSLEEKVDEKKTMIKDLGASIEAARNATKLEATVKCLQTQLDEEKSKIAGVQNRVFQLRSTIQTQEEEIQVKDKTIDALAMNICELEAQRGMPTHQAASETSTRVPQKEALYEHTPSLQIEESTVQRLESPEWESNWQESALWNDSHGPGESENGSTPLSPTAAKRGRRDANRFSKDDTRDTISLEDRVTSYIQCRIKVLCHYVSENTDLAPFGTELDSLSRFHDNVFERLDNLAALENQVHICLTRKLSALNDIIESVLSIDKVQQPYGVYEQILSHIPPSVHEQSDQLRGRIIKASRALKEQMGILARINSHANWFIKFSLVQLWRRLRLLTRRQGDECEWTRLFLTRLKDLKELHHSDASLKKLFKKRHWELDQREAGNGSDSLRPVEPFSKGEEARLYILKLFVYWIQSPTAEWKPEDRNIMMLERTLDSAGLNCKDITKSVCSLFQADSSDAMILEVAATLSDGDANKTADQSVSFLYSSIIKDLIHCKELRNQDKETIQKGVAKQNGLSVGLEEDRFQLFTRSIGLESLYHTVLSQSIVEDHEKKGNSAPKTQPMPHVQFHHVTCVIRSVFKIKNSFYVAIEKLEAHVLVIQELATLLCLGEATAVRNADALFKFSLDKMPLDEIPTALTFKSCREKKKVPNGWNFLVDFRIQRKETRFAASKLYLWGMHVAKEMGPEYTRKLREQREGVIRSARASLGITGILD